MHAEGILTTRGGMTSHAAVVARGMGKPLRLRRGLVASRHYNANSMVAGGVTLRKGESSPSTVRPAKCSPAR